MTLIIHFSSYAMRRYWNKFSQGKSTKEKYNNYIGTMWKIKQGLIMLFDIKIVENETSSNLKQYESETLWKMK